MVRQRIFLAAITLSLLAPAAVGSVASARPDGAQTGSPAPQPDETASGMLNDKELEQLLNKLERALAPIRTARISFRQEKHLSLFKDVVVAHGACLYRHPDAVRFEITDPFQSIITAHGDSIAKYEYVDGNWQRKSVANADVALLITRQIATWLHGDFRSGDLYDLTATAQTPATLILTPRHAAMRSYIVRIEAGLNETCTRIKTLTIREPDGNHTVMHFGNEQLDMEADSVLFDTSRPEPAPLPPAKTEKEVTQPANDAHEAPPHGKPRNDAPSNR